MLWVRDMDRSIVFYRDVIGLDMKMQSPGWSELAFGNATIALHLGSEEDYRMTGLNFEVTAIEDACRELISAGGRVVDGPYSGGVPGLSLADVEDPDGNRFQFSYHA